MMRAPFHHFPTINHVNDIRLLDGAEPMRDRDGGATSGGGVQSGLHDLFGFRVQGRGGFVEEEDFGVAQEGAGDGDALLLAAREHAAFAADDGGEAVTVGECRISGG